MKSQESTNKDRLPSAVSSGIISFINQPAVIVSKSLTIVEANQFFYDFFNLLASVKDIKSLINQKTLSIQSNTVLR